MMLLQSSWILTAGSSQSGAGKTFPALQRRQIWLMLLVVPFFTHIKACWTQSVFTTLGGQLYAIGIYQAAVIFADLNKFGDLKHHKTLI